MILFVKSHEEIADKLSELIHRHRRRYHEKHERACALNCVFASPDESGCTRCDSWNPEQCRKKSLFVPIRTKEEIDAEFTGILYNPKKLQHEYRDLYMLLWVLGQYDQQRPATDQHEEK